MELFVPGRLCLFGEHSDWAGGHRRQNSELEKGYCIVAPINEGNYAKVRKLKEPLFRFRSSLDKKPLEAALDENELLNIAEKGGLFSYVAGTAYEVLTSYKGIGGIEIDNYKTDIPVKKGVSSSASICVLTARAFSELYGLGLTKKREMELAYFGENNTPSRCGKMDQACAYDNPVLMVFDGDRININELSVGGEIYMIFGDLKKGKNTIKILEDLNKGYPFPQGENDLENRKKECLGLINKDIVLRAKNAICNGNVMEVGKLMNEAQKKFDKYVAPCCPEELTAPKLHEVLDYPKIQKYIYGGKGVGSQGDGSFQMICKSREDREKVKSTLESKLNVECMDLDIKSTIF